MTPNSLPPSNAGIGKRLNIASAIDSIPPNIKNIIQPPDARTNCHTFAAPIGPESLATVFHLSAHQSCVKIQAKP